MKELFARLLPEIADFYAKWQKSGPEYDWGYEFLYNPEDACRRETKILLMTINPQADARRVIVTTPCPAEHALWDGAFKMQKQLLRLFEELRNIVAPSGTDSVKEFASHHIIASSAVPFRTHSAGEISPDMWMFSRYLWGRVFKEWEPRLILTVGYEAYKFLGAFFGFRYKPLPENRPGNGTTIGNRWIQFEKDDGSRITLAGFPHFSYFPAFSRNYDHNSPAYLFLRTVCENSLMQE